jgi:hypothetical protein
MIELSRGPATTPELHIADGDQRLRPAYQKEFAILRMGFTTRDVSTTANKGYASPSTSIPTSHLPRDFQIRTI